MAIKADNWSVFCDTCGHLMNDSDHDRDALVGRWAGREQVCNDCADDRRAHGG